MSAATCERMEALNYSEVPAVDKTFASNSTAIIPSSRAFPLDISNNVQLKFPIPATPAYFDPGRLYFRMQVQAQTVDPSKKVGEKVAVIAGFGYTMWDKLRLTAHGKVIKEWNYSAYAAHVGTICNMDSNYISTVLASTSAFSIDTTPVNDATFEANQGLAARARLVARNRKLDMYTHPFIPCFMTQHLLPCNAGWTIEGTLNTNDFSIIYDDSDKVARKLVLLRAELWVSMVELEQSAHETIERGLNAGPMQIPFVDFDVVNLSIQSGQAEYTSPSSVSPFCRRIYIVFVNEADFIGKVGTTPFYYQNYGIRQLEIAANGKKIGYTSDFSDRLYIEPYVGLLDAMGVKDRAFPLDRLSFAYAQTIFAADLTKSGNLAVCEDVISATGETTTWGVQVHFKEKLKTNVQMIVIMEQERILTIDYSMNVTIV